MSAFALALAYNLALLAGTVWLVGWHGWSGWWFLLTIGLIVSVSKSGDDE